MNILVLCYEFPPIGGGGSKVVHGLSSELARTGHEVTVVTMGFRGLPRYERVNGVHVHRVPCIRLSKAVCTAPELALYAAAAVFALLRLIRRTEFDILHVHFIFPDGLVSLLLKQLIGCSYIITAHGSDVPGYNPDRFKLLHRLLAPLWMRIVRNTATIVCPSRILEALVLRQYAMATTTVIPNGFDEKRFTPGDRRKMQILLVSRMLERKGVQHLLQAVAVADFGCDVHVVGDGPYLATLRRMATAAGAKVRFWGWLDNDSADLRSLYEGSSIFVFPSEAENFPVVLLEAMAASMAIVTTKGTGCAEVVGDAALLVSPRDPDGLRTAIGALVRNPEQCRRLGAAARRRLEQNFSWTAVARRYADLYLAHARQLRSARPGLQEAIRVGHRDRENDLLASTPDGPAEPVESRGRRYDSET